MFVNLKDWGGLREWIYFKGRESGIDKFSLVRKFSRLERKGDF